MLAGLGAQMDNIIPHLDGETALTNGDVRVQRPTPHPRTGLRGRIPDGQSFLYWTEGGSTEGPGRCHVQTLQGRQDARPLGQDGSEVVIR